MKQPTVLVTGVTGFAGRYLADYLLQKPYRVIGAARTPPHNQQIEYYHIDNLDEATDWTEALKKAELVVHLAGRVHQMRDKPENSHLYFATNVDATLKLARQAAEAQVRKFVYVSSVKAMGEGSEELVYDEKTLCQPEDAHGSSKFKAEVELGKLAAQTRLPLVILRPPLMYGPQVKGNMASLIKLVRRLPVLPLGGLQNRRSFLGLENFSSAVAAVLESERICAGTYLLSDGEAISTSELIDRMISVFSPGCRNIALPKFFWQFLAKMPFVAARVRRLTGSLAVDSSAFARELKWEPPMTMTDQFREMR